MQLRSGTVLQVLAVENQSYINYGMPVRIMGYDAAEYNRQMKERRQQVSALWKQVESSGQYDTLAIPVTYAEYMSGILKTDRLHPVYTICLYSGTENLGRSQNAVGYDGVSCRDGSTKGIFF